jgi:integrase
MSLFLPAPLTSSPALMAIWRAGQEHDLRRTAASGMARLGVAPHVVEKVLNHKTGIISGVAAV